MDRAHLHDRRLWSGAALLVVLLWWGPDLLWPYRRVVNLGAAGEVVGVLGDSIPAGFGDGIGAERAWPTLVAKRLGLRLVNHSVPGDTTEKGLARLDALLNERPRLVIVELGGNDMLSRAGPEPMKANLDAIFTRIQARGAMVVYASIPTPIARAYETAWAASCREHGVWYVRDVLAGVFGSPHLMYDSIHPNAEGQALIAERMTGEVEALLRAADAKRAH